MSLDNLFEKLDAIDPGPQLVEALKSFQNGCIGRTEYEVSALRANVETARWSAEQNPAIAKRYCRELGWSVDDLAAMMVLQCAIASLTSGEFVSKRGVLTPQGEGFRFVWQSCIDVLLRSGRIDEQIAEIEKYELEAEIEDTEPATPTPESHL